MGMKLSLTVREGHGLRVFENRMLRRIFGHKREELQDTEENGIMTSFMICTPHQMGGACCTYWGE
jgi:hypothetical protein